MKPLHPGLFSIILAGLLVQSAQTSFAATGQAPSQQALSALETWNEGLGHPLPEGLGVDVRLEIPFGSGDRIRLGQSLQGVPVRGHEITLVLDQDGSLRRVEGEPLSQTQLNPVPRVESDEAERIAQAFLANGFGQGRMWPARSALVVWIHRDGTPRLAWGVDASTHEPIGAFRIYVDARDGHVLGLDKTLWNARANVYPTNPMVSDLVQVDLANLDDSGVLQGPYASAASCTNWNPQQGGCLDRANQAEESAFGDFIYVHAPAADPDPFAEVMMYHHLDKIAVWFEDRYGFRLTGPFGPQRIEGLVNFEYNNAFYGDADGDGIGEVAFGDSNNCDYAYDADVIYHEFGHAVFGKLVDAGFMMADDYGMERAPGGLNEGTADIFALILTGDPRLAEYAGAGFTPYEEIRHLEQDRHCPTDIYGESHADGMIWAALAWNMIEDERIGTNATADLVYGAISTWPSDVTWEIAGASIGDTAADLLAAGTISQEAHDAMIAHGEASGVIGCGRVVSLDTGAEPRILLVHPGFLGDTVNLPAGTQFSLEAPEGATRLSLQLTNYLTTNTDLGWNLYMRRGEAVGHDFIPTGPASFDIPYPADFDRMVEGSSESFVYELTLDSEPRLEPGSTYYFSLATRMLGSDPTFINAEISVSGTVQVAPSEPESSGCSCTLAEVQPSHLGWLWLGIPLLASRRRR